MNLDLDMKMFKNSVTGILSSKCTFFPSRHQAAFVAFNTYVCLSVCVLFFFIFLLIEANEYPVFDMILVAADVNLSCSYT